MTDATDWRVEYPFVVLTPDTEAEMAGLVKGCIELGLTIIPRGGGTGYTGGAIPLTWKSAVINTEKLEAMTEVRNAHAAGLDHEVATVWTEAGVVTQRVADAAERGRFCVCGGPDLGRSVVHWRQHRHERGRQEGRAVGHGAGQPGQSWRMVTPQAEWLEVTRLNHNMGKIHDAEMASFELQYFKADGKTPMRTERLDIPGKSFRKEGLGKDVTDKFLSGLPGIQKEGCDGLITSARWVVHRMPKHTRTVCLEFFGNAKDAVPSIVEIKDFMFAEQKRTGVRAGRAGAPGRPLPEGRGLRHQVQARLACPRWCCWATLPVTTPTPWPVPRPRWCALPIRAAARASSPSAPRRARNSGWTASARRPSASHTNAFKINEDVVIPLPRMAEYTDGIERINIELSLRNKLALCDALRRFFAPAAICRWAGRTMPAKFPRPNCWKTAWRRRWRCCAPR